MLIGLCLVLLVPLTLTDVPPLLDYPNHLARLFVLSALPDDPVLRHFYKARWGIIPNLGLDLTVPPLLLVFPVHVVGRAIIGLCLVLPVLGAAAYHRALSGRLSYWPLTSVLFAYNAALIRGFLNFILSVGLALLFAATWLAWRDSRRRLALTCAMAGAVVLFFCHLTGLLFFALLIGGHELLIVRTDPFRVAPLLRRAAALVFVFVAPALLYAASDLGQMRGEAAFRGVADKAHAALMPVINYVWPLDLATAAVCVVLPLVCLAKRWALLPWRALVPFVLSVLLFLGLPTAFKGTFDLDTRFIVMAAFLLTASLVPHARSTGPMRVVGAGLLALFAARMAVVMIAWHGWAANVASFRAAIAPVQAGDVVLTVRFPRPEGADIWTPPATARRISDGTVMDSHLPALLLIEHRAWWPYLFDNPSQQPIETREPFRALAALTDHAPRSIALLQAPEARPYTHVLIWDPPSDPAAPAGVRLRPIDANALAALFAIERDPVSPSPPPPPVAR